MKIKKITIFGSKVFEVGQGVSKILDKSKEFENSIFTLYQVYDYADNLIHTIENCPVIVDYDIE